MKSRDVQETLIFLVAGVVGLAVGIGRLLFPLSYPSGDPRNSWGIELAISFWVGGIGMIALIVGLSRLVTLLRHRRR